MPAVLTPEDQESLVRLARAGDAASFGALVAAHEARARAVAVSVLGYGAGAEDAVQDGILTALTQLDELREPAAFGAWLRTIVRHHALAQVRRDRRYAPLPQEEDALGVVDPPERLFEDATTRAWLWTALSTLTEPLRTVTLLRYFSSAQSYAAIAAVCGVPVGTVRSRLSQARVKLLEELKRAVVDAPDPTLRAQADAARAAWFLAAVRTGELDRAVDDLWGAAMTAKGPAGQEWDRSALVAALRADVDHGVAQRVTNVQTAGDVQIWETRMTSEDLDYCSAPAVLWLQRNAHGRVRTLRLYHPEP